MVLHERPVHWQEAAPKQVSSFCRCFGANAHPDLRKSDTERQYACANNLRASQGADTEQGSLREVEIGARQPHRNCSRP